MAAIDQEGGHEDREQHQSGAGIGEDEGKAEHRQSPGWPKECELGDDCQSHQLREAGGLHQKEAIALEERGIPERDHVVEAVTEDGVGQRALEGEERRSRDHELPNELADAGGGDEKGEAAEAEQRGTEELVVVPQHEDIGGIERNQQQKRRHRNAPAAAQHGRDEHGGYGYAEETNSDRIEAELARHGQNCHRQQSYHDGKGKLALPEG